MGDSQRSADEIEQYTMCGGAARRWTWRGGRILALSAMLLLLVSPCWSQQQAPDLTKVNIEDLMNMEVTSVSKKEQKLSRVASAIFVITQEDIQQSGATNIPDLLRMVPGIDVAQINANTWAISARGFSDQYSNELLVMVDGRNVYSPTYGGVFWDTLELHLGDIERVELILVPGGSVWGANAVNGVINIITKKAGETRGAMIVAGGGNVEPEFGTAQYGGSLGKETDYRVYSNYFDENHMPDQNGQNAGDGWHMLRGGFRTDSKLSAKDTLMLQGDMYSGEEGTPIAFLPSVTSPGVVDTLLQVHLAGGFLQSVWNHSFSARSDTELAISFDNYKQDDALREVRRTVNADFQHHIVWGERQDVVWGLEYRYSMSHSDGSLTESLNPADVTSQSFSSFVQDEIAVVPERFYLTVGTKLEHSYYTGFALMPSARASYAVSAHHTLWAAVSRAYRTPAAFDTSIRLNFGGMPGPGGTPVLVAQIGNPNFKNEGLTAYEVGYRAAILQQLSIDLAAYYNAYDNQQTVEPGTAFLEPTPPPTHLVEPTTFENLMHGETHGLEIVANWKIFDRWTVSPSYDFERIHMHTSPLSQDTDTVQETEGSDPHVHARLRSHVSLKQNLAWDASACFVDRLEALGVPSYTRLDTELSWRLGERLSLSLVGQNLSRDHHLEFADDIGGRATLVKRSAYAKLTWRF